MTSTMAGSQYQSPPQAPPLFTATPDSILADVKKINELTKSVLDKVVADVKPENATFANVLEPALVNENKVEVTKRLALFYQSVSTDEALREASTEAEEIMNDFYIELKMREDVFKLVDAAYAARASQDLDTEAAHLLQKDRQKYIRNGLLLPAGPERDRFKEIQKRLSQLCIQSQKLLNEEKGGVWFTPEELEGVPSDDVDISQLEKGTGENEGKVKLTFKYNHLVPTMKYAARESTRRTYTVADANKVWRTTAVSACS